LGKLLDKEKPDIILVQGDTTTTFTASLVAYYKKIAVAHVEAGLRSNNIYSPFPEEINRRITSLIAKIHFAPTVINKKNLIREGIKKEDIVVTGNTVIDSLLWIKSKIYNQKKKYRELKNIDVNRKFILVTGHRRENFGSNFENICNALKYISEKNDINIVYPVHLNPNVRMHVFGILSKARNIKLIQPLEYEPFIYLMDRCNFIITDSGGIQEEAPTFHKPILVTRI
jgi:UDP-N-acetylglucosamine 2-epimerase (non-hydrolysing)